MSIMDDTSEHLSHMGGNHKQLSFKQVVEVGADCEYILRAAEVRKYIQISCMNTNIDA